MKGKTFLLISIMLSVLLAGCSDFSVPKGIAIEASPKIEASTGSIDIDMSGLIDIGSILKSSLSSDTDSGIACFDYYADDEDTDRQQKYLFYYPLMTQDLDIGKYLDGVDFGSDLNKGIEKTEFNIPEINGEEILDAIDIPADSAEITSEGMNGVFTVKELGNEDPVTNENFKGSPYESQLDTETFNNIQITCTADVEKVKFRDGYINILFSAIDNPGSNYELKLTGIKVLGKNDSVVARKNGFEEELVDGAEIKVPFIKDEAIDMTAGYFNIVADVSMSGGVFGRYHEITVTTDFVDLDVEQLIKNGGIFDPVSIGDEQGEVVSIGDAADSFETAVIDTGNITIDLRKDGKDPFEGITDICLDIDVTQQGNTVVPRSTYTFIDGVAVIDLKGKTILNKDLVVKGSVYSTDTVYLESGAEIPSKIYPKVNYDVQKFSSVSVKLPEDFNSTYVIETEVPEELKNWVSEITFPAGGCGIELSFDNKLTMDLTTNVVSSAFTISDTKVFPKGEITDRVFSNPGAFVLKPSELANGKFDVTVNIDFGSAYDSDTNILTLNDIDAGATYSIEGNANVIMEYDTIRIAPPENESGISGSFPEEGSDPLDLSGLTSILGEGLALPQFETYLYVSSPSKENMAGADMTISLGAEYKKGEENVKMDLINGEKYTGALTVYDVAVVDPLVFNKIADKFVGPLGKSSLQDEAGKDLALTGLSKMINDGASDLHMNYTFSLDGFTLTKSQIDNAESTELSVSLVMIIPVGIDVVGVDEDGNKQAILDFSKLLSSDDEESSESENGENGENNEGGEEAETDLFGRSADNPNSLSDIGDFMKAIALTVVYDNQSGISGTLRITNDTVFEGRTFTKDITLKNGKGEWKLGLSEADCRYIMNAYPFSPNIQFILTEDQKIYRDGKMSLCLIGSITAEINEKIDFADSDDSNEEDHVYGGEE